MSWVAIGVAVVGGVVQHQGNKKAAKAAQDGGQASIDEQRRQFDLARQDQMPWLQAGQGALGQMQSLNAGNFSQFFESPDYKFAMDQGLQGLERGAAARGGMYSGGADADRMKYAAGLGTQNYNSFYNRLQSMAGQGQTTASGLGQMGMQMGSNIGNTYQGMGNARASGYMNNANITSNVLGQGAGALSQWYGQNSARNGGGTGWYLGNNPGRG